MTKSAQYSHQDNDGFIVAMAPDFARRQLRISAVLVALIAALSIFVAITGAVRPLPAEPVFVKMTIQAPGMLQVKQAGGVPAGQTGG